MFGYVTINQNEMKVKDYGRYRAFYCGLCYCLKKKYGLIGQSLLSYDVTFLDVLINAMYEEPLTELNKTCIVHPGRRHRILYNSITFYCADMSVLLSYYKALDDINDSRLPKRAVSRALYRAYRKVEAVYPEQCRIVRECVTKLSLCENEKEYDLDKVAGLTGTMLAAVFAYKNDEWRDEMERVGFYLGKFVYLMDAYDDLKGDIKAGRYNIWEGYMHRMDFEAYVENSLTLMMSDCAREFEKLPIVQDTEILRNIIYSGVWTKYMKIKRKQIKEAEDDT